MEEKTGIDRWKNELAEWKRGEQMNDNNALN